MDVLGDSASLRAIYLRVSDDKGEFFGAPELEESIITLSKEAEAAMKSGSADQMKECMKRIIEATSSYHRQINIATNMSSGILVKHQIRLGQIFIQQKGLLKKIDSNNKWLDWFKDTYGASSLRSAQDFMKLAETPNIIRYAFFGRERLIEFLRAITPYIKIGDPIGENLVKYNIIFNPEADLLLEGWKSKIDAIVAMEKIKKMEKREDVELEITYDTVKSVIESGVPVDSSIIADMLIIKESGGSVTEYLQNTVLTRGPKPNLIERAEKKETVQVLSKKLRDLVDFYTKDRDAIAQINMDAVNDLKNSIEDLTALIAA
jgi:hypothetical protein